MKMAVVIMTQRMTPKTMKTKIMNQMKITNGEVVIERDLIDSHITYNFSTYDFICKIDIFLENKFNFNFPLGLKYVFLFDL